MNQWSQPLTLICNRCGEQAPISIVHLSLTRIRFLGACVNAECDGNKMKWVLQAETDVTSIFGDEEEN